MRLTLRNVGTCAGWGSRPSCAKGSHCDDDVRRELRLCIRYLGEDGVAAFSIACYFFPIIFMVYNAIGQSAQPILSLISARATMRACANVPAGADDGPGRPDWVSSA